MSRVALILVLAVTAILSVVAAVVLRSPPAVTDPRLAPFEVQSVTRVEIERGGVKAAFVRDARSAAWTFESTPPVGAPLVWPGDATAISAALATLASTEHLGVVEPLSTPPAARVVVTTPKESITYALGSSALGGRTTIEVTQSGTTRTFAAASDVLAALTSSASPLLEPAALRWPSEPTKLTLAREDRSITLERSGRGWRITAPITAAADRKTVAELQAALTNLRMESISSVASGLQDKPALTITIESGPAGATFTQTIAFASSSGSQATVTHPAGSAKLTLRTPDLEPIFVDLKALLAKQAVERPAADITALLLLKPGDELTEPRAISRDADRWKLAGKPLPEADTATLTALLETLCTTPAAATLLEIPTDFEPIAKVRLRTLQENQLADLSIGLSTPQAAAAGGVSRKVLTIISSDGAIARLYPVSGEDPMLAFLRANLP
jgi:hypothetical protein